MGILSVLFPSKDARELKKLKKIADKVVALEPKFQAMSDEELAACTQAYKDRYAAGEKLDDLLPEAFATVREASYRVLGMKHFYVQIIGGIVLHQGRIAEMKTGEGKTLVATLPAYLNALTGNGMHIVTVNEYLAKYHCDWMGKVFRFLGLTVSCNMRAMNKAQKREAYNCDVMYTTNSELGFDYLRDNMVRNAKDRVQRELTFAIVDEVDSILIDEARTPLIISGRGQTSSEPYIKADKFVRTLEPGKYTCPSCGEEQSEEWIEKCGKTVYCSKCGAVCEHTGDYERGEKNNTVYLNENGAAKAEAFYGIEDLSDFVNQQTKHYIDNALRAHVTMKREVNYIVVDGEVIIVDEFTGRQMIGRRFSNGLHQAIEAKEHVQIKAEDKTLASITYQNFFRLYKKLSGMTGTAKTEENEFETIYKLDVVVIPTNKPMIRVDEPDKLYVTHKAKLAAIAEDIKACYERKQPVLVGTVSVERSEELSALLKSKKIPHVVLNAKYHEKEAEIVAQAGKLGAVTIATNMAGRGTDIMLGGNADFLAKNKLGKLGYSHDLIEQATSHAHTTDEEVLAARAEYKKYYELFKKDTDAEKEEVVRLGGLRIIGTERHESRRIDNQLRGRSGRQGDPGSSAFYISGDDDIVRIFGGDMFRTLLVKLSGGDENMVLESKMLTKQVENAQARVEDRNFSIRKHVLSYDDVLNKQREIIYEQRRIVLDEMDVHEQIRAMIREVVTRVCDPYLNSKADYSQWDYEAFNRELEAAILPRGSELISPEFVESHDDRDSFIDAVTAEAERIFDERTDNFNKMGVRTDQLERDVLLRAVDSRWTEHISAMEELRQGISLVAYGQRDPVLVYRKEGFDMFDEMVENIQSDVVKMIMKIEITVHKTDEAQSKTVLKPEKEMQITERHDSVSALGGQKKPAKPKVETVRKEKQPGPNEPCPCGSGKKYKNCCGRSGNYYKN